MQMDFLLQTKILFRIVDIMILNEGLLLLHAQNCA